MLKLKLLLFKRINKVTRIKIQCVKQAGAFLFTTVLSCGPSQLFGCIKIIVDSGLILANGVKKQQIKSNIQKINADWDAFKTSSKASLIARKLGIEIADLTEDLALAYFESKKRKTSNQIKKLARSIGADACAMIPLLGAHISWRVATNYKGKSFTAIFSHGVQQLLENSKDSASRPLFLGRASKKTNTTFEDAETIEVATSTKKRPIEIYHATGWNQVGNKLDVATVVLFHPNVGGAEDMDSAASFYREKGYNTLTVVLGGYPGSPGVTTSEKSMYQDIEAVKQYLVSVGVKDVGYHGFSLGSGAAMQAAAGESLANDLNTLFVVLDQPYSSAANVGGNAAGSLGRGVLTAGCPAGIEVELPGNLWTRTDGLDNLAKAAILNTKNIPLICVQGDKDDLMGRKKIDGKYTENFAKDLLIARYGENRKKTRNLISHPDGHGANILHMTNERPGKKLARLIPNTA